MRAWFILGTAAELIKMYPLIVEAGRRRIAWSAISSGQSPVNLRKQWSDFQLPNEKLVTFSTSKRDLQSSAQAFSWFAKSHASAAWGLRDKFADVAGHIPNKNDYFFVHGDTLTTIVGANWSKRLGVKLVHIEAGLRSGDWREPFPEEISRKYVSHLADWNFAPFESAADNLRKEKVRGKIISTGANTLLDSLRMTIQMFPKPKNSPAGKVVVNLHRFENLKSSFRWGELIKTVLLAAEKYQLVFVMHPPTEAKLNDDVKTKKALLEAGVELRPRVPFTEFAHWLQDCEFLISDGGSNQEETFFLGKPCLIMREKTERIEGLGTNAVLSRFDHRVINAFLNNPNHYKRQPMSDEIQPTARIYAALGV